MDNMKRKIELVVRTSEIFSNSVYEPPWMYDLLAIPCDLWHYTVLEMYPIPNQ